MIRAGVRRGRLAGILIHQRKPRLAARGRAALVFAGLGLFAATLVRLRRFT